MSDRPFRLSFLCSMLLWGCRSGEPARSCDPPLTQGHVEQIEKGARCAEELKACRAEAAAADLPAEAPPSVPEPSEDAEFEIKVRATYVLGQGNQTIVMNPKPIDDGLRRFAKGAICRFDPEGKVTIIAKHLSSDGGEEDIEYLVRYTRDPAPEALKDGALEYPDREPYECPTGTVFFLDDTSILEEDEPDTRYEDARKLLDSEKP